MKVCILIFVLQKTLVASVVDNPFIRQYDPELTFFKAVLKFKEEEIQYALEDL